MKVRKWFGLRRRLPEFTQMQEKIKCGDTVTYLKLTGDQCTNHIGLVQSVRGGRWVIVVTVDAIDAVGMDDVLEWLPR